MFCSWNLLTLGSLWLVDTCFVLDKAVVSLAKHKAVFLILCPCLLCTASFHEACLPGLDSPTAGGCGMRADLQTHYSEERFSGTEGTNRLQAMTHSHHVELSRFCWCFPELWHFSLQPGKQSVLLEDVVINSVTVSTHLMATQLVYALISDLHSKSRQEFQLSLPFLQNRAYGTAEGQAG